MPTAMPEPALTRGRSPSLGPLPAPPAHPALRLFFFYSSAFLLTGLVGLLFADLLWRSGWSTSRTVLLTLFVFLFFFSAVGCMHGVFGFFVRMRGDARRITQLGDYKSQNIEGTSTAIVFPIYNEDVVRVYEGLRVSYESLDQTGQLARFDFFILSDSTDPDKWEEEERRWYDLIRELNALGRIYYRRRVVNEGKKSGNIRDFLSAWGRRYRYFIVFDADSVMRGETVVDLRQADAGQSGRRADSNPTVPALVNAEYRSSAASSNLPTALHAADLHRRAKITGPRVSANYWGHKRHHPHGTVHGILRSSAAPGPQAFRRANPQP